jgi:hypothetical protein
MIANKVKKRKPSEAVLQKTLKQSLDKFVFSGNFFTETDGSVTLSLNEIDLVENAPTEQDVRFIMGNSIIEYAKDYCSDFTVFGRAPNRKKHLPYVFKALMINDSQKIGEGILCRLGEN